MTVSTDVRRYGNLRRPRGAGLFGFSGMSTWIGLGGMLLAMMAMMVAQAAGAPGLPVALVFTLMTVVAVVPTRRSRRTGLTGYDHVGSRVAHWMGRENAKAIQGPAGFTPDGKTRLPGMLAGSRLLSARNAYGETFGVIEMPCGKATHYSIVLEGAATGTDLVDSDEVDRQVAHWGEALAMLGQQRDVIGVSVIVETAPDPGVRLRAEVESAAAETASPFSREVMAEIVESYPRSQSTISTRLAITLTNADDALAKKHYRTREDMHTLLANLLPGLVASVRVAGAGGACRAMSAQEIVDAVRVCFDPTVAEDVERAQRDGGTGLSWEVAGPMLWDPQTEFVAHDRAWSVTYQMVEPPGTFFANTLEPVLQPHPEIMRKRVALLYRPMGPFEAPRAVEKDTDSTRREANKRKATERAVREHAIAQQVAREEAAGAGLTLFGMAITGTTDHPDKRARMESAVKRLAAPARLRMRPSVGNQAAAFLSTLPIGVVLPEHTVLPASIHAEF